MIPVQCLSFFYVVHLDFVYLNFYNFYISTIGHPFPTGKIIPFETLWGSPFELFWPVCYNNDHISSVLKHESATVTLLVPRYAAAFLNATAAAAPFLSVQISF